MNKVQDGFHTPQAMAAPRARLSKHPVSKPCSDRAALCMGIPALGILLLGFWWLGML